MPSYTFHQLDVFTDRPLAGNPLAVFPDAGGLDSHTMQALAREMNLSETVFVTTSDVATRRLRFFTPAAEIPLAGHPTIGTWWLLATLGELDLPRHDVTQVTQETGAGVLPVDIHVRGGAPCRVAMTQKCPQFGPTFADVERLGAALGGNGDVVRPGPLPQLVDTALPQLIVPMRSLDTLKRLPSGGTGGELVGLLREIGTECVMCFTDETEAHDTTVHCRMFAPGFGVPEDPATGSASGALAAYLVRHGLIQPTNGRVDVLVEQGIEIGRPSRIHAEVALNGAGEISEVRVGGEAVTIITGEVRL